MATLLDTAATWLRLGDDPRILYSLAAAALLAFVSFVSGLGRLDLAPLFRPPILLRLLAAVAVAFALVAASETTFVAGTAYAPLLVGLSRFPLYLVALAYGPSFGLGAGLLFAAATAVGPYPGWHEAILTLELMVLGWLAIQPSPRQARWAGPAFAPLAYALALGTAGVAFLTWRDPAAPLMTLLTEQLPLLPGLAAAWLLLACVSPTSYDRLFPGSRIAPRSPVALAPRSAEPAFLSEVAALEKPAPTRGPRLLDEPALPHDDPNG